MSREDRSTLLEGVLWLPRSYSASPMTLNDGGEAETGDRANDRPVEDLAGQAETDESDVEHEARDQSLVMMNSGAPSNL